MDTQIAGVSPAATVSALPILTTVSAAWERGRRALETEMKAAGRAEGTRKVRLYWLDRFAADMTAEPRAPWDLGDGTPHVERSNIVGWLAGQPADRVWLAETRRSVTASIRLFYRAAETAGFTAVNPAVKLPSVYVPPPGPRPAPDDVIEGALAGAALRDWLAIGLMGGCGLRREEACLVRTEHLVWRGRGAAGTWMLRVMGKGRRRREVPVPPTLARVILQQTPGWLFPGPNGHLTKDYLGKLVRRRLPGPWTPHTLRHAAATAWGDQGLEIDEISTLLGHSRTDTTRVYLARHSHRAVAAVHSAAERFGQ